MVVLLLAPRSLPQLLADSPDPTIEAIHNKLPERQTTRLFVDGFGAM